jgi:hypothetical protein
MIRVLDPTNEMKATGTAAAPRPESLAGKTVGFISNGKEGTKALTEVGVVLYRLDELVAGVVGGGVEGFLIVRVRVELEEVFGGAGEVLGCGRFEQRQPVVEATGPALVQRIRNVPLGREGDDDVVGTRDPSNTVIASHRAAIAGEPQSFEYQLGDRWYAVSVEQLKGETGEVAGSIAAAFDITEQRATQQRLVRSEELLAQAQRVAHIGSFEWDIASNMVTWSDELLRIYGLEPGQFK